MADQVDTLHGAAFDDLYSREIEPELRLREKARREAVQTMALIVVAGALIVVVECILANSWSQGRRSVPPLALPIMTLMLSGWLGYLPVRAVMLAAKADVINALCKPLNIEYRELKVEPPDPDVFRELNLLPRFDSANYEDRFTGRRDGRPFELCEATLIEGTGKNKRPVFRGQLFKIAYPRPFEGTTVVLRDSGWLNRFECPHGLAKVGLEDPQFETIFKAYGSDQVAARVLLTPTFMEQVVALETAYAGRHLRFAFVNGDVLIAIEGGDHFEIGGFLETLVDRRRVEGIADDLDAVFRLIDSFAA